METTQWSPLLNRGHVSVLIPSFLLSAHSFNTHRHTLTQVLCTCVCVSLFWVYCESGRRRGGQGERRRVKEEVEEDRVSETFFQLSTDSAWISVRKSQPSVSFSKFFFKDNSPAQTVLSAAVRQLVHIINILTSNPAGLCRVHHPSLWWNPTKKHLLHGRSKHHHLQQQRRGQENPEGECPHTCSGWKVNVKILCLSSAPFVSRWWSSWLTTTMKSWPSQRKQLLTAFTSKVPSRTSCSTGRRRSALRAWLWVHAETSASLLKLTNLAFSNWAKVHAVQCFPTANGWASLLYCIPHNQCQIHANLAANISYKSEEKRNQDRGFTATS